MYVIVVIVVIVVMVVMVVIVIIVVIVVMHDGAQHSRTGYHGRTVADPKR